MPPYESIIMRIDIRHERVLHLRIGPTHHEHKPHPPAIFYGVVGVLHDLSQLMFLYCRNNLIIVMCNSSYLRSQGICREISSV